MDLIGLMKAEVLLSVPETLEQLRVVLHHELNPSLDLRLPLVVAAISRVRALVRTHLFKIPLFPRDASMPAWSAGQWFR